MANKISFCTVCMNRVHHIQATLIKNIEDNLSYPHLECILLDYNSSDGLEEWIKSDAKAAEYIERGILKYYKTTEPVYFDRSHSRNLMFKLATGDIICNIDADNYAGEGFAVYVNSVFEKEQNIYLVADTQKRFYFLRNAFGRFGVKKSDFITLGGLDEKMKSYGSETVDFYERLEMAHKKEVVIENTNFLKTISHGDEERISNEFFLKSLKKFFIRYISSEESEILFLYKDDTFENCIIVPENINTNLPASLKEGTLSKGTWSEVNDSYHLQFNGTEHKTYVFDGKNLIDSNDDTNFYYLINEPRFLLHVAKNYAFITNTETLHSNKKENKITVNNDVFGTGIVRNYFREEILVQ